MIVKDEMRIERNYVKNVFRRYKENELYLKSDELPNVTQGFQLVMVFTGDNVSLVEEFAVKRADATLYNKHVIDCVNRLTESERKIIYHSYMGAEYVIPWRIWEEISIGRTLFYTTKSKAIGKLYVLFKTYNL